MAAMQNSHPPAGPLESVLPGQANELLNSIGIGDEVSPASADLFSEHDILRRAAIAGELLTA